MPAHKAKIDQRLRCVYRREAYDYHFLPGYAHELNPDEMVWNYMAKRTGTARKPACEEE